MKDDTTESTVTNFDKTKNDITISRDEFFDFIKNKKDTDGNISTSTQHYLNYFDQYQKTGKIKCWNWAGLWDYWWFFYRRMYRNGLIIIIFNIFFDILCLKYTKAYFFVNGAYTLIINPVSWFVDISFFVFLTMYSNYTYLSYANKQISKGILRGGTSVGAIFVCMILYIFLDFVFPWINKNKVENTTIIIRRCEKDR